jgi:hypothetical protein
MKPMKEIKEIIEMYFWPYIFPLIPFLVAIPLDAIVLDATRENVVFIVNKVERVVDAGGEGARYLVFTKTETFENTDRWSIGKFNSSDLHGSIEVNKTYTATVVGGRVPELSWYRNIISIKEK